MLLYCLIGLAAGFLNGLFGSGGGLAAVPLLEKAGLEAKNAHATSVAVIVPLCVISLFFYLRGGFEPGKSLVWIPGGIAGAVSGSLIFRKVPNDILRRIFGAVMLFSSIRILTG